MLILIFAGSLFGVYTWQHKKVKSLMADVKKLNNTVADLQQQVSGLTITQQFKGGSVNQADIDKQEIKKRARLMYVLGSYSLGKPREYLLHNTYISPDLLIEMQKADGFDPFTCSQMPALDYTYSEPVLNLNNDHADMGVRGLYYGSRPAPIQLTWVKVKDSSNSNWLLDKIVCPKSAQPAS